MIRRRLLELAALLALFAALPYTLPLRAQVSPRSSMTGYRITGAQAGKAIAVLVIPYGAVWTSDELVPDPKSKWRAFVPVYVWRQRKIEGDPRLCLIATFQFEVDYGYAPVQQVFVIPAGVLREFDAVMFEYRPWYSIATSISDPPGSTIVQPADVDRSLTSPPFPSMAINCSDKPGFVPHVRMEKE